MKTKPTRPILRYFGGKWKLGPWIISHFPPHRCYVELFGGGASVLIQKPPAFQEVYNDLDEHIVDLFRVFSDPELGKELIRLLELTPFARQEFEEAYTLDSEENLVEKARKIITLSYLAYSTDGVTTLRKTGFRSGRIKNRFQPASRDWTYHHQCLWPVLGRLKNVIVENQPALQIIDRYDHSKTLFYADPPYPHDTRWEAKGYVHEMNKEEHRELLERLNDVKGMVAISTYKNDLYEHFLPAHDWKKSERKTRAQAGNGKANKIATEQLWLNPAASKMKPQQSLFENLCSHS